MNAGDFDPNRTAKRFSHEGANRSRSAHAIVEQKFSGDWFERALINDEAWIFFISEALVARVLALVDDILTAAGHHFRAIEAPTASSVASRAPCRFFVKATVQLL